MILNWVKNIGLIIMLYLFASSATMASDRLNGLHIKEQAAKYFLKQGLKLSLVISDKRSFFHVLSFEFPSKVRKRLEHRFSSV